MAQNLMTVLLVKDDATAVRLVERLLAELPFRAESALESVGRLSEAIRCLTHR